ncbi:hypothetical protein ABID30_001002 [Enterococcus rotai]
MRESIKTTEDYLIQQDGDEPFNKLIDHLKKISNYLKEAD